MKLTRINNDGKIVSVDTMGLHPAQKGIKMTPRENALTTQLHRKNRAIIAALIIGIILGGVTIGIISADPVWIDQVAISCQM